MHSRRKERNTKEMREKEKWQRFAMLYSLEKKKKN